MGILSWIVFGLVVGIIAKLVTPGRDPGGFIITMLLGIAGALLGGFIGRAMGFYGPNETAGWLMSIGGAILLLVLYRLVAATPASSAASGERERCRRAAASSTPVQVVRRERPDDRSWSPDAGRRSHIQTTWACGQKRRSRRSGSYRARRASVVHHQHVERRVPRCTRATA